VEEDTALTPMGSRGVGEIGTVGTAAAVANAAYHASPRRSASPASDSRTSGFRCGCPRRPDHPGPVLIDVVSNADEVAIPPTDPHAGMGLRHRQDQFVDSPE